MSVVLVIIALIVGGVMVGQEMVHSAELNSVVTDVNRIKTGVANFRLKYNAWPGDMTNATNYWGTSSSCPGGSIGTCNGNGDGNVDAQFAWTLNTESYRFWQHLSLATMIPGNFTGIPASYSDVALAAVPGLNTLSNKLGGYYQVYRETNTLRDGNMIGMWGANAYARATTAAETRDIDSKIDDGRPLTGIMGNHPASGSSCYTTTDPNTSEYAVSSQLVGCYPQFWFD